MDEDSLVRRLLEEALNTGRTPDEVCAAHPELLPEVRARWLRIQALSAELERAFPSSGRTTLHPRQTGEASEDLPQIDGYEVNEVLGRGGIGVVYRARDLTLGRDVAIKLLQDRYASDSPIGRRFADEARITAQLQHPGIPPVHELGTLPNGRPFLVMKLIKGRTLEQLLAARSSPSDDRGRFAAAFEQVCQAVAYAHAHHVIHRDLKPSNVMVGAFGEVQVMDWGLAKVLAEPEAAPPVPDAARDAPAAATIRITRGARHETQAYDLLGTPAFMSPEQAIGAIDRIDARSDVYSLGGIMCAILTGRPPFVADTVEATRQLAAQARLEDARARLAACGAEPGVVALCLRCLAPEPDSRPQDAGEVATVVATLRAAAEERARRAELERVGAAEQGKRRRVLLAAGVAILVILLAGLSVSLWQTWRAMQALAGEKQARERAFDALRTMTAEVVERKFTEAVALSEDDRAFLRGVIAQFDAFAAIKGDDADSRAVRAEGRLRVGAMRYRLGEFTEAEQDYDQALSIYKQLAADFPTQANFRRDLVSSHTNRGTLLRATGRPKEAEREWNEALGICKELVAGFPNQPDFLLALASSHVNRGILLRETGRLEESGPDYDEAVKIHAQLVADFPSRPDFRRDLASTYTNRGVLMRETGRVQEAEEDYNRALNICKQLADDFPARSDFLQDLAGNYNNRGVLLHSTGRTAAEKDYDRAVSIYKQLAADFPSRPELRRELASCHVNRANLFSQTGRLNEAETDYDHAVSIYKQLAADFPNQPDLQNELAKVSGNLANHLLQQGNAAAAKPLLLESGPHHLAALKANPDNPVYRQFYRYHLNVLVITHAVLLEAEDAVRTAETCRDLGWDAPTDAYKAACWLSMCVPIATNHEQLDDKQRREAAQFYGDEAMKLLREAVSKGFKAATHIKEDKDLNPLRPRDDFQKLLTELEALGSRPQPARTLRRSSVASCAKLMSTKADRPTTYDERGTLEPRATRRCEGFGLSKGERQ